MVTKISVGKCTGNLSCPLIRWESVFVESDIFIWAMGETKNSSVDKLDALDKILCVD